MGAESFGVADYVLFALTLLASAAIGLFYSLKGRRSEGSGAAKEALLGGSSMPIIPVALSLLTSFLSGITLLGLPVEVYKRGIGMYLSRLIGIPLAVLVAIFIVLPILFDLRPVSVYEYFERRYNSKLIRRIAAGLYVFYMISYIAVVLYAPSVALASVTNVSPWIYVVIVGLVCNLYTSFGGLKAVVWTDTLQAVVMFAGVLTLFIKGCADNGGLLKTFEIAGNYKRYEVVKNWSVDPFQYITMWAVIFGGLGFWLSLLTFNQISVQRYLSMPNIRKARHCLWITIPGYIFMCTLADLLGIVMFTKFLGCDPITTKQVQGPDELVIYYAIKTVGQYPGVGGVFLACLFSGTLSTVSSGINSLAAVIWEDFFPENVKEKYSDRKKSWALKLIAITVGCLAIAMAFAAAPLGGILKATLSAMGAIGGPIVGLYLLGMLVPWSNKYGAMVGALISIIATLWIALGNAVEKPYKVSAQCNHVWMHLSQEYGRPRFQCNLCTYSSHNNSYVLSHITGIHKISKNVANHYTENTIPIHEFEFVSSQCFPIPGHISYLAAVPGASAEPPAYSTQYHGRVLVDQSETRVLPDLGTAAAETQSDGFFDPGIPSAQDDLGSFSIFNQSNMSLPPNPPVYPRAVSSGPPRFPNPASSFNTPLSMPRV